MENRNTSYHPAIFYHPGETLAEKLEEMQMSPAALATVTGVPVMVINGVISGDFSVSADLALAFEHATGIPADFWVLAQHEYDNYLLTQQKTSYVERLRRFSQRAAASFL